MVDKNICKTKISAVELTALIILYVNHYNKFTLIQHQVLTRCRHWWDTAYQSFGEFGMNQSKTVCLQGTDSIYAGVKEKPDDYGLPCLGRVSKESRV